MARPIHSGTPARRRSHLSRAPIVPIYVKLRRQAFCRGSFFITLCQIN